MDPDPQHWVKPTVGVLPSSDNSHPPLPIRWRSANSRYLSSALYSIPFWILAVSAKAGVISMDVKGGIFPIQQKYTLFLRAFGFFRNLLLFFATALSAFHASILAIRYQRKSSQRNPSAHICSSYRPFKQMVPIQYCLFGIPHVFQELV